MSRDNPLDSGAIFRPTPTDEYLGNPHKGCCTFQHFNGDPLFPGMKWIEAGPLEFPPPVHLCETWPARPAGRDHGVAPGYLPATVAYCRWFWHVIEPEEGQYDFSMIEGALKTAEERGQTLALGFSPFGHVPSGQPGLPHWYAKKYPTLPYEGISGIAPAYDSPEFLETWGRLVREIGKRYDADPRLETVDVSFVGPWGEGDGQCSSEQCDRVAQVYQESFRKTPRLPWVAGSQLETNLARGSGWRVGGFGDLHRPGIHPAVPPYAEWNHMYDYFPKRICQVGAQDVWKTAPIHLETMWVPMFWYQHGYDIDFIIQQALKYHATYFMPKSVSLPGPWLEKLAGLCRNLGYRYVFRQATIDRRVAPRGAFRFQAWIENVGVAPIYRPYHFALRLRQESREQLIEFDEVDIRKWLPGDVWIERNIELPATFQPGAVEISAGLIDPKTRQARIHFAVKERFADCWALLGGIEVRS